MARKIKKKKTEAPNRQGTIILIGAGVFLAVIAIFLIIFAIVQNVGKGNDTASDSSEQISTAASDTEQTGSSVQNSEVSVDIPSTDYMSSVVIDQTKDYYADINIRNYGKITVKLDYEAAPITTRNFIYLAESGFYNGLTFHRIMEGFMMQGGDPDGNGTGGSEHNIYGEFSDNGYTGNKLSHTRGAISMARNSFDMNSASSQFFIVQTSDHTGSLDGSYAAFGYVTEGIELVDAVCSDAKPTDDNGSIPRDQQPVIESVIIHTAVKEA